MVCGVNDSGDNVQGTNSVSTQCGGLRVIYIADGSRPVSVGVGLPGERGLREIQCANNTGRFSAGGPRARVPTE